VTPTPTRRRWFQYSLATMLLVVTLIAMTLGWAFRDVRKRDSVRAMLEERGVIFMDYQEWQAFRKKGRWVAFTDSNLSPPAKYSWIVGDRAVGICWTPLDENCEENSELLQKYFPEAHKVKFRRSAPGSEPFVPDNSW
jgi:hypothetical protein